MTARLSTRSRAPTLRPPGRTAPVRAPPAPRFLRPKELWTTSAKKAGAGGAPLRLQGREQGGNVSTGDRVGAQPGGDHADEPRSEERRVGKECRSRWWPD